MRASRLRFRVTVGRVNIDRLLSGWGAVGSRVVVTACNGLVCPPEYYIYVRGVVKSQPVHLRVFKWALHVLKRPLMYRSTLNFRYFPLDGVGADLIELGPQHFRHVFASNVERRRVCRTRHALFDRLRCRLGEVRRLLAKKSLRYIPLAARGTLHFSLFFSPVFCVAGTAAPAVRQEYLTI
jgi:hypothetical protein